MFQKVQKYKSSFVAKLSWKKNFVFEKIFVFDKIYITCRKKMFLYGKKSFILKIFFTEKNVFYREKNMNENVKNIYLI